MASSWPRVVIRPTFAPLRWMSALVPTVVPCVSTATLGQNCSNGRSRRSEASRIAASMPSAKFSGVDGHLVAVMRPLASSTTQSVKVPPMSTPTSRLAGDALLVELERIVRIGVYLDPGPRRLHAAAHHVQTIADDRAR